MNYNAVIYKTISSLVDNGTLSKINFKTNEQIYKENSPCHELCYILEGTAEISTQSYNGSLEVISIIKEKSFFGHYLLFQEDNTYLGDVISKGNLSLVKINKKTLLSILNQNPAFLEAYITYISEAAFNIKQQVKLLSHKNAIDRIIFYLESNQKNNICNISSISSLAKEVNLPRETTSRAISKLERDKFLIHEKDKIILL